MKTKFLKTGLIIAALALTTAVNAQTNNEERTIDLSKGTITTSWKNKMYKIKFSDNKIVSLNVDGKDIPEDQWSNYSDVTKEILVQIKKDRIQAEKDMKQAKLDMIQAEKDMKQAQLDIEQSKKDIIQAKKDVEQAALDQKQAQLDILEAKKQAEKVVEYRLQHNKDIDQAKKDIEKARLDIIQAQKDIIENKKRFEADKRSGSPKTNKKIKKNEK